MSEPVHVLVLEDDPDMREMIAYVLREEGYQVQAAARGAEAVSLASNQAFDLVIADIRMEGMDGLEALRRVREQQPQVRSLVVTGYSTEDDSIRAIRLGVGDYLKKPFEFKEFLGSVRRLVSERRLESARQQHENRLRASLWRSTEALARLLDSMNHPGRPLRGLVESALLAGKLAEALALSPESVHTARLAALLAGLGALEGVPFQTAGEDLPAGLALVLGQLEERWDGQGGPDGLTGEQIAVEARVVAAVLDRGDPGRCDPRVLEALQQVEREPSFGRAAREQGRHLRGLLSLARALEEARDAEGARQAYAEIALAGRAGPEIIEAHLGLSRLASDPEQAASEARRAAAMASQVAPSTASSAYLRAGLLLKDGALLDQAARLCRDLRNPAGEAVATLGNRVLAGAATPSEALLSALTTLMAPENAWELARTASWLLPFLLEQQALHGVPLVERALAQLARDVPREYERRVGEVSAPARRLAVQALAQSGGVVAEGVLRRLASDPDEGVRAAVSAALKTQETVRKPPVLRIFTLGAMEVFRGEDPVADNAWRSQKGRYVFAYLAARRGQPVSEDALVDAFWPDDFEKGRRNLYWYTSVLRRCLRPEGWPEDMDYILRGGGCLRLNADLPRWHDLEELEDLCEAGLRGPDPDRLRRGVALYRGPYLEACYMDWTVPIRERVALLVSESLSVLLVTALREARHQEALDHAQQLLRLDPCRQEAFEGAIEAQLALGRPEAAVRLFEQCRQALAEELAMEPGIRLMELHQRARLSLA